MGAWGLSGRVLVVAASDSGGGAGIQADIKTITSLGAFSATAITALTAQNTVGIHDMVGLTPEFVARQMQVVLDDIGADCIKTGMLRDAPTVEAVADVIERHAADIPLVVDPVLVAKRNTRLLDAAGFEALKRRLIVLATVLTPNLPEAEALTGMRVSDLEEMEKAAVMLRSLGPRSVVLTGGHMDGEIVCDVLATDAGTEVFKSPRIESAHTHGTGCTLASGIAACLAQGMGLRDALMRARAFVRQAIARAPGYGKGCGPMEFGP
jgi:hydroxymethylpyrimidine/phosphomethylpyrimidine kinase